MRDGITEQPSAIGQWSERLEELHAPSAKPTFRTPFCVLENFLLQTHTMDNLPAKQGYRSYRILDFARMGSSQETGIIHRYGPPCRRSTSQSTP